MLQILCTFYTLRKVTNPNPLQEEPPHVYDGRDKNKKRNRLQLEAAWKLISFSDAVLTLSLNEVNLYRTEFLIASVFGRLRRVSSRVSSMFENKMVED